MTKRIVLCRDCVHLRTDSHGNSVCRRLLLMAVKPDFFCGFGEVDDGR